MTTATTTPGSKRHRLAGVLLALLVVWPGATQAKQARASMSVSVTVLSSCTVTTAASNPQPATACQGTTPPVVEQREQRQGQATVQLTVVTF